MVKAHCVHQKIDLKEDSPRRLRNAERAAKDADRADGNAEPRHPEPLFCTLHIIVDLFHSEAWTLRRCFVSMISVR